MTIESRAQEIVNAMNTFGKATYHRSEVLPELFALQQEVISLTFNEEHADQGSLRIWDVERHLEQMNADLGGVADEELQRFEAGCKDLCNMIKAEISGSKGESKAFRSLERLRCFNRVLHNVELTGVEERSEIDALVITGKGLFIVEVKNTARDIFIDEAGNYFRTGEYLKWDSHIAAKMEVKSRLLRNILKGTDFENAPITGVVVFTDNRIQVRNCCEQLNTCFLSQLPYIIQDHKGTDVLTEAQVQEVEQIVESARCTETYPLKIDVPQFKQDFAVLMATLEHASAMEQQSAECEATIVEEVLVEDGADVQEWSVWSALKTVFGSRYFRAAVPTAAAFAITFATTALAAKHTI